MLIAGDVVDAAANLFLAAAIIGCAYLLLAAVVIAGFEGSTHAAPDAPEPVTVLVPLCGHEPQLVHRLTALCRQDYPAPIQVVCGLQSEHDPALAAVKAAAALPQGRAIEWHVDTRQHGRNMKVSNLINMAQHARHDTFVLVDSDIEVEPDFVAGLVGTLRQPGVGAVSCLYHGVAAGGFWARLSGLRANAYFLPNVVFALSFGLARPCLGGGLALSRETLRRIGGFQAFVDTLGEDYAIGAAVRDLGKTTAVSSFTLGHVFAERSAREFFAAELRAARTIRSLYPHGYAGSFVTHPFALALIAVGFGAGTPAVAVMLAAFACRIVVCAAIERRFDATTDSYFLLPLRDLLSFAIQVASYCGSTVIWRGQRYRLSDRTLVDEPAEEALADAQTPSSP